MPITLTRRDEFAVLTIDRPEALNALSFGLIGEIEECLDQAAQSDARALLVTGAGQKAFCAGADIAELIGQAPQAHKRGVEFGQRVFSRVAALPMPSVAIINGYAFGGGLELALSCSFRLATANARMGLPEIKLGLIPGYGGTQRLPRLIGEARALEMILTGRTVKADEALQMGLVNRLLDGADGADPLDGGIAFAREFSCYSLASLRCAREAVQRALQTTLAEGLKIEADQSTLAYQSADAAEGMAAFLAKRPANFTDK
ncbi:MAG: enoyl-CoA hydratase-related protein [Burkholderiaceae bacterium]